MGGGGIEPPRQAFQAYTLPLSYPQRNKYGKNN